MKYSFTSIVAYFGKYSDKHGANKQWCRCSIGINNVACRLQGAGMTISVFYDEGAAVDMFTACTKRGTKAQKISELCSGDNFAFRINVGDTAAFADLEWLKDAIENGKYGFGLETVSFEATRLHIDADGKPIQKNGKDHKDMKTVVWYFCDILGLDKETQMARELKHWIPVKSDDEQLQEKLASLAKLLGI